MAMNKQTLAVFLMVAVLLMAAPPPAEALTCGDVQSRLSPCSAYVIGGSSAPSQSCCNGLRSIAGLRSRQDRQTACNCLKAISRGYAGSSRGSSLPGSCGVSGGYAIGPNVDCSSIS